MTSSTCSSWASRRTRATTFSILTTISPSPSSAAREPNHDQIPAFRWWLGALRAILLYLSRLYIGRATLEFYNQVVVATNPFEAQAPLLLGLVALLVGLIYHSEAFDRLLSSRIKGPLYLAYGSYGLPLMLVLMEIQRRTPRRSGGGFRILGVLVLIVVLVILGVLALMAFLIYRYLRRRR